MSSSTNLKIKIYKIFISLPVVYMVVKLDLSP